MNAFRNKLHYPPCVLQWRRSYTMGPCVRYKRFLFMENFSVSRDKYVSPYTTLVSSFNRRLEFMSYKMLFCGAVTAFGCGAFAWNNNFVRQGVKNTGAQVVEEGIKSEGLQSTAVTVSKSLLQEILRDHDLSMAFSEWLLTVARASDKKVVQIFKDICSSDVVWTALRNLADQLVSHLCESAFVKKKLSSLIVQALNTDQVKDAAATWVGEFLQREDVVKQVEYLLDRNVLRNRAIKENAIGFAGHVVEEVLRDPCILEASRRHVLAVLSNDSFQTTAGSAAWNVVKKTLLPRWIAFPGNQVQPSSVGAVNLSATHLPLSVPHSTQDSV